MDRVPRLLFVCSGNLCRSPMAMYLARDRAERRNLMIEVDSAGTLGIEDRAPPPNTAAVMREIHILLDDHRSKGITEEHMAWADRVLVMTYDHATTLRERFPEASVDKVQLLGPFGSDAAEVADPIGRWKMTHRKVRRQLERCVDGLLDRIEAELAC